MLASDNVRSLSDVSKMPPSNIEAEMTVLGGLLFDENAYARVEDRLVPCLFSLSSHQIICTAIIEIKQQGGSSDLLNVTSRIKDQGNLDKVGGQVTLMNLFDSCVTALNIDQHVDLLIDKFVRRKALEIATQTKQAAFSPDSIGTSLDAIASSIADLATAGTSGGDLESFADIAIRVFPEIEARQESGDLMLGESTGLYDLDEMIQGLQRGAMVTLAGRPAMGKSALAVQVAQYVAKSTPVAIFSLEMSKEDVIYRALSLESGVPISAIRSGRMDDVGMGDLHQAAAAIAENCWVSEIPTTSVAQMNALARSLKLRNGNQLGLIVIDYLQLMGGENSDNRVNEVSKISRQIKIMARSLDVPVLVLSQLSRAVEARANKRPTLSDLRESGAIEQDSDQVIFLYRDDYYNPESCDKGLSELIIAKNRHGPTGTVKALFEPHLARFRNLARR